MTGIEGNMALLLHKVLQLLWKEMNIGACFHVINLYITENTNLYEYPLPDEKIFKTPANILSFFLHSVLLKVFNIFAISIFINQGEVFILNNVFFLFTMCYQRWKWV